MANFVFIHRLGINLDQIRFVVRSDDDETLRLYFAPDDFLVLERQQAEKLHTILEGISSEGWRYALFYNISLDPTPREKPAPKP